MKDVDLSIVGTHDLLAELARRFSAILVVTERPAEHGADQTETSVWWRGGMNHALGLALRARMSIQTDIMRSTLEDEDAEEES